MATGMDSKFFLSPPAHKIVLPKACFPAGLRALVPNPHLYSLPLLHLFILPEDSTPEPGHKSLAEHGPRGRHLVKWASLPSPPSFPPGFGVHSVTPRNPITSSNPSHALQSSPLASFLSAKIFKGQGE